MKVTLDERIKSIELKRKEVEVISEKLNRCTFCGAPLQRKNVIRNGVVSLIDVPCQCIEIQRQQNIEKVRRECFISPQLSTYRYDMRSNNGQSKANQYLARFIRRFMQIKRSAVSLYIYSESDNSRTYNLARVANGLIDRGYTVKYLDAPLFTTLQRMSDAAYTELIKKLAIFDVITFADIDLVDADENELKFLYGVISLLMSSGVTLLISSGKNIDNIQPETRYGQKLKNFIKRKCVIIPVFDDIKDIEPKQIAKDVLWLFDDEEIKSEE